MPRDRGIPVPSSGQTFGANRGTSCTVMALHGDLNRLAMMGGWPSVIATNPGGP
jgi:hypothetical protein